MSKTGTYKMINGELVKVSDRVPSLKPNVWFPSASDHSGYTSEMAGVHFRDKNHKREYLKEKGLAEA